MEKAYTKNVPNTFDEFTAAREYLERIIGQLQSAEALKRRHDETEKTSAAERLCQIQASHCGTWIAERGVVQSPRERLESRTAQRCICPNDRKQYLCVALNYVKFGKAIG